MNTKPTIKNFIVVILPGILIVFIIFFLIMPKVREGRDNSAPQVPSGVVNTFEECVNAGNPIMESYPRQCRHGDRAYTESIQKPVGSTCEVSSDCSVPMEYAIQSNCPYSASCRNNGCVVVCPMWNHSPGPEESASYSSSCKLGSDCDCSECDKYRKYPCECLDGQCSSVVKITSTSDKMISYTNENFGIFFQYPSDWQIQDEQIVRGLMSNNEVVDTVEKFEHSVLLKMGRNESIFFDYES
ncbi:MAG: hypothetical protein ABII02_03610 [Candidatus Magasanikbacteria bacterium]